VSAALAVTVSSRRRSRAGTLGFGLVALIFIYALVENVIEKPNDIAISAGFILGILIISVVSRVSRTTELPAERLLFDEQATRYVDEASSAGALHIIANKRQAGDVAEYRDKEAEQRAVNPIPPNASFSSSRSTSAIRPTSRRFWKSAARVYSVFVASPGDVAPEREASYGSRTTRRPATSPVLRVDLRPQRKAPTGRHRPVPQVGQTTPKLSHLSNTVRVTATLTGALVLSTCTTYSMPVASLGPPCGTILETHTIGPWTCRRRFRSGPKEPGPPGKMAAVASTA
jgi:hypothetical protein